MRQIGIDPRSLDSVALSHGHRSTWAGCHGCFVRCPIVPHPRSFPPVHRRRGWSSLRWTRASRDSPIRPRSTSDGRSSPRDAGSRTASLERASREPGDRTLSRIRRGSKFLPDVVSGDQAIVAHVADKGVVVRMHARRDPRHCAVRPTHLGRRPRLRRPQRGPPRAPTHRISSGRSRRGSLYPRAGLSRRMARACRQSGHARTGCRTRSLKGPAGCGSVSRRPSRIPRRD